MNGQFDVSPDQLRHHARAVEDVATAVRSEREKMVSCHVSASAFGVFFGWMAEGFERTQKELGESLEAQGLLLGWYGIGLNDTASEFEELEAAVARLFSVGTLQ